MSKFNQTERIAINTVESIFITEFDWIFREQSLIDVGIDAYVEISNNGIPTGKTMALQIKGGISHLKKSGENEYVYYVNNWHSEYWRLVSVPTIIIFVISTSEVYWQYISDNNLEQTSKAWKLKIPKSNKLNKLVKIKLLSIQETFSPRHNWSFKFGYDSRYLGFLNMSLILDSLEHLELILLNFSDSVRKQIELDSDWYLSLIGLASNISDKNEDPEFGFTTHIRMQKWKYIVNHFISRCTNEYNYIITLFQQFKTTFELRYSNVEITEIDNERALQVKKKLSVNIMKLQKLKFDKTILTIRQQYLDDELEILEQTEQNIQNILSSIVNYLESMVVRKSNYT